MYGEKSMPGFIREALDSPPPLDFVFNSGSDGNIMQISEENECVQSCGLERLIFKVIGVYEAGGDVLGVYRSWFLCSPNTFYLFNFLFYPCHPLFGRQPGG